MQRNFEIKSGIYLLQQPYELDLHSNFDFRTVCYSVSDRVVSVHWQRGLDDWVSSNVPATVSVEFREVSEFRFLSRDPKMPFTEDNCVSAFGYWTDDAWADGDVLVVDSPQIPESDWLTAISFTSGATILIQAVSAHARIQI